MFVHKFSWQFRSLPPVLPPQIKPAKESELGSSVAAWNVQKSQKEFLPRRVEWPGPYKKFGHQQGVYQKKETPKRPLGRRKIDPKNHWLDHHLLTGRMVQFFSLLETSGNQMSMSEHWLLVRVFQDGIPPIVRWNTLSVFEKFESESLKVYSESKYFDLCICCMKQCQKKSHDSRFEMVWVGFRTRFWCMTYLLKEAGCFAQDLEHEHVWLWLKPFEFFGVTVIEILQICWF